MKEEFEGKYGNTKTNASTTSRIDDETISIKVVEFWRLCYIFI